MNSKEKILAAVTSGIVMGISMSNAEAVPKKNNESVHCFGINSAKGTNGCSIDSAQITIANKVYNNAYANSTVFDCAGNAACSAAKKILAWLRKDNEADCFKSGGFLIKKNPDGKLEIVDKNTKAPN